MIPRAPSLLSRLSSGLAVALEGALFGVDDLLTLYHDARDASALRGELAAAKADVARLTVTLADEQRAIAVEVRHSDEANAAKMRLRAELTAAEKQIAELTESRNAWRNKALDAAAQVVALTEPSKTAAQKVEPACCFCVKSGEAYSLLVSGRVCKRCGKTESDLVCSECDKNPCACHASDEHHCPRGCPHGADSPGCWQK